MMGLWKKFFGKKQSTKSFSEKETMENEYDKELISACNDGNINEALRFINLGANINAKDSNNASALLRAISSDLMEVAYQLIKKGCDVTLSDNDGFTALYIAATSLGDEKLVKRLIECGANINEYPKSGGPILIQALEKDFTEVAAILIDNGVDLQATKGDGWTPLECAETRGYNKIIEKLRFQGQTNMATSNSPTEEIKNGDFFKMNGAGDIGTVYGKCIKTDGLNVLAEVFSKYARMGDSARISVSEINSIISKTEFEEGLQRIRR